MFLWTIKYWFFFLKKTNLWDLFRLYFLKIILFHFLNFKWFSSNNAFPISIIAINFQKFLNEIFPFFVKIYYVFLFFRLFQQRAFNWIYYHSFEILKVEFHSQRTEKIIIIDVSIPEEAYFLKNKRFFKIEINYQGHQGKLWLSVHSLKMLWLDGVSNLQHIPKSEIQLKWYL